MSRAFWALDSNHEELDVALQPAQRHAEKEYNENPNSTGEEDDILVEPIILRELLSEDDISLILNEASADGVWPRGCTQEERERISGPSEVVSKTQLSEDLRAVPHHFAWDNGHVVLYMHNEKHWFVRQLPDAWGLIRGGMEARPWMNGAIPVLNAEFVGIDSPSMDRVRTVELHHYGVGGGLVTPGHRDCGSELTISVLLSDPTAVSGGDFVTYRDGVPVAHKMGKGDAILFNSEMLHNISTVTSGVRKSLVVELWPSQGKSSRQV